MFDPNRIGKDRKVDLVFCIDGTGSMSPCFDSVKRNAKRFYTDFVKALSDNRDTVDMLRIKVIVFRDYKSDGAQSMTESAFFELPSEDGEFAAYLDNLRATGGCGEDANGLEALYYAMKSDFVATGRYDRQVITLFADTTAIPLRDRKKYAGYPSEMPDEDGLLEMWQCTQRYPTKLRDRNKRLVIFAPAKTVYEKMHQNYDRSIFRPVEMHRGLDNVSFDDIIKLIAASVAA